VVFTDPRQIVDRDALSHLLENFSDPDIGCVSGNLLLGSVSSEMPRRGLGLYWGLDKKMWELESTSCPGMGHK
jgi:hypothetical protein